MFNYDKVIKKHLDVLSKYDEPEKFDAHMRNLYSQYKVYIVATFLFLASIAMSMVMDDHIPGIEIVMTTMCFAMAIHRWIDLQNLVLYKSLRSDGLSVQEQASIDD